MKLVGWVVAYTDGSAKFASATCNTMCPMLFNAIPLLLNAIQCYSIG